MFRSETGDILKQKLCCMYRNIFTGCDACFNDGDSSNKCTANKTKTRLYKFPRYTGSACTRLLWQVLCTGTSYRTLPALFLCNTVVKMLRWWHNWKNHFVCGVSLNKTCDNCSSNNSKGGPKQTRQPWIWPAGGTKSLWRMIASAKGRVKFNHFKW